MTIERHVLILAGGMLFVVRLLQSIVGFGFTLMVLPSLLFCGLSLPQAVAIGLIGGITGGF